MSASYLRSKSLTLGDYIPRKEFDALILSLKPGEGLAVTPKGVVRFTLRTTNQPVHSNGQDLTNKES